LLSYTGVRRTLNPPLGVMRGGAFSPVSKIKMQLFYNFFGIINIPIKHTLCQIF